MITNLGEHFLWFYKCIVENDTLTIGQTTVPLFQPDNKTKIPETLFYDTDQNLATMEGMLQDYLLGEHLLLIGNQGVGKNKLVDRMLKLLNRPREYIQVCTYILYLETCQAVIHLSYRIFSWKIKSSVKL